MSDQGSDAPAAPEYDLSLVFGTEAEGRASIGMKTIPRNAIAPVSARMVTMFCALIEDGNPNYWQRGLLPPSMLMTLDFRYPWHPDPDVDTRNSRAFRDVPLPGKYIINVETDTEYFAPVRVGDQVTIEAEVADVSMEKVTSLGRGHFIRTVTHLRDAEGGLVGRHTNILLRYTPEDEN